MFGFGKKRRAEKEASEKAQAEAELRSNLIDLISIAEGGVGAAIDWPLVLGSGELLVYGMRGAGLFEPRRLPGHYSGRSAGVSVPVMDGIRLRLGKSAGTFVQGDEKPALIDTGDVSFTTQRVVFQGGKYTREWLYAKLIGLMHYADHPWTAIQVSNREKTSGIIYSGLSPETVRLKLTVAVAIFNGEGKETAEKLRDELSKLDGPAPVSTLEAGNAVNHPAAKPTEAVPDSPAATAPPAAVSPPAVIAADDAIPGPAEYSQDARVETPGASASPKAVPDPATSETPPAVPPPMWAADPSGRHQSRYWDGGRWTDYVSDGGQESRDPLPIGPP